MICKNHLKVLILIMIITAVTSCNGLQKKKVEHPVARVYDLYLYPSDLTESIPEGVSDEDSIRISRRLIEEWARERLLLKRAEQYLSIEQKNIEKQIEDNRLTLLTFKYKQSLLAQNLDTSITDQEVQDYYKQNSSNYILDSDIVKVTYIKVPRTAPQLDQVKRWYRSNNDEELDQLEKYCIKYAEKFIIKGEKWLIFTDLAEELPVKIENPGRFLSYTTNIDVSDSIFNYLVHINERIPESQVSPFELVEHNIRSVILNKRKIEFIQNLENSVFQDGLSRNQVEIY
jgi:hypothetical protein